MNNYWRIPVVGYVVTQTPEGRIFARPLTPDDERTSVETKLNQDERILAVISTPMATFSVRIDGAHGGEPLGVEYRLPDGQRVVVQPGGQSMPTEQLAGHWELILGAMQRLDTEENV